MKNNIFKNELFRHIVRSLAFVMVFVTIFMTLEGVFYKPVKKAAAWEYVTSEDAQEIDILFTGNSHTFRSFDDELISEALDINARILACPSANGGIVVADLTEYLTYTVPKVVVVELCPFMVNNYEDMRDNKQGIVYNHFESIPNPFKRLRAYSAVLDVEDIPGGMFQIFRTSTTMKERIKIMQEKFAPQEEESQNTAVPNGYGYVGVANIEYYGEIDFVSLEEQYKTYQPEHIEGLFCDENRKALEDVLKLAEKYDFEVWLSVSPVAYFEKRYMDQLPEILEMVKGNERVKYIDITIGKYEQFGFVQTDFHDLWHLSRTGAQKLTCYMIDLIAERMGLDEPDYSDIVRYKAESVQYLENGLVRCTMWSHGDALYRFTYYDENENKFGTEFSECNYFDVPEEVLKSGALLVEMISPDDTEQEDIVYYRFMEQEEWIILPA